MKNAIRFIFLILLLFCGTVSAEETNKTETKEVEQCTYDTQKELQILASNITISYITGEELIETDDVDIPESERDETYYYKQYYFDIKIYNMNSRFYIKATDMDRGEIYTLDYQNIGDDGAITIRVEASGEEKRNWKFEIYTYEMNCINDRIRQIKLTLPMYNYYSELEICNDIPDFYMCRQFITTTIDSSDFYKIVNDYKEKLDDRNLTEEKNINIADNTITKFSKYKYFIIGGIIAIGIIVTIIIIIRREKRMVK